jgi:hypothetical protein
LYEAQISVAVTGINHRIWTAYGAFDTYHGSNDAAEAYQKQRSRTDWIHPDPLMAGQLTAHKLVLTPRDYYFKVFEIRIQQVLREWRAIIDKVEEDIEQYVFRRLSL